MAKGDDIQERLLNFAVAVIKICSSLPKTQAGIHISNQLLRSGTSPAPNYSEARGAESIRDFIHKLGIVLKELNESYIWFTIIMRTEILTTNDIVVVMSECDELCKIISSSIKTAKKKN